MAHLQSLRRFVKGRPDRTSKVNVLQTRKIGRFCDPDYTPKLDGVTFQSRVHRHAPVAAAAGPP